MTATQLTFFPPESAPAPLTPDTDQPTLPNGWRWVKLKEVSKIIMGQSPSSDTYNQSGEGLPFYQGKTEFGKVYPTVRKWCSEPGKIAESNDVLLSVRAPVGPTNLANQQCCIGRGLAAIRYNFPEAYKFLYYYFQATQRELEQQGTGSTFAAISGDIVRNLDFPLPPLAEQQSIVARIEELLSEVDAGVTEIEAALKRLKTYRQAVLHHFLSNEEWERVTLVVVAEKIQIGPFGTQLHQHDYIEGGTPLVNPTHIKKGKIVPDEELTVSADKYAELSNYYLQTGDTIMGRRGEMARCALITDKEAGWLCGTGSLFIRPNLSLVNPQFLAMLLGSSATKNYLEKAASGSTMSNLNLKILNNTPILFPDLATQNRIIQEIEARLSQADALEATLRTELQRAGRLRQSVLKQAFMGRLIPSGPL